MWLSSFNQPTVPRPCVIQPCISENVGMYRKLYKQVFNTNPTLFVMLSITCEAQYWYRHLSVTNYCSILLCSHIHVRVYLYTSCCLYNYGEKRQDTRDKQVVLKMAPSPHREEFRLLIFCCIINLIFGGFVVAIFLILMKKWFALWQLLLIIL